MTPRDDTDPSYLTAFRGTFTAALRWHQLDALWARIDERADAGWFIYAIGEPPPRQPTDASGVRTFIREIDQLLRDEHREERGGVDDEDPTRADEHDEQARDRRCDGGDRCQYRPRCRKRWRGA